ncbi:serum response factor-binding protein 1 [Fopius arisanus]|uniref:Serum response factor-binding protein 1 n=1 Tax=Fopius arisanus TaxID=64838 RepID=A0A9R1ST56_9HYME|nr:PREDICTED: serum response factor-binding protein 1-like [Fopius arisanus]
MSHVAANNEIIRMRATVRKARIGTIWKITKQTKLLKNRTFGDEKTLRKCKKKYEKFIREIKAIKKLKDDDIAKYAILNTRSLTEVLSDPTVNRKIRVMTKLAYHKALKSAVDKFREKFPHYKLGKKQLTTSSWTELLGKRISSCEPVNSEGKDLIESSRDDNYEQENTMPHSNGESEDESVISESTEHSENYNDKNSDELSKSGLRSKKESSEFMANGIESIESEFFNQKNNLASKKSKNSKHPEQKQPPYPDKNLIKSNIEEGNREVQPSISHPPAEEAPKECKQMNSTNSCKRKSVSQTTESSKNPREIKCVSELTLVKRIEIDDSLEVIATSEAPTIPHVQKIELEKVEDSFFISATCGEVYKSVVVPRVAAETPQDEDMKYNSPRHKTNNRVHSSRHDGRTLNFKKDHHVRQNTFERSKDGRTDEMSWKDKRRMGSKMNDKFDNAKDKSTLTKVNNGESLHPSWIARKKQQEILKQGFQGKKIVFNDD